MILIFTGVRACLHFRRKKRSKAGMAPPGMPAFGPNGQPVYHGNRDHQENGLYSRSNSYRNDSDGGYGATPMEGPPPAYGGQGIHLQQYPSQQSLPQPGQVGVQPREF